MDDDNEVYNFLNFILNTTKLSINGITKEYLTGFNVKRYNPSRYSCELSKLLMGDKNIIEVFKNKFSGKFFELQHPFYNNIKTRAVYSGFYYTDILHAQYIFFIDENNKYPWVSCGLYEFGEIIVTPEGFFSHIGGILKKNNLNRWTLAIGLYNTILGFTYKDYYFKDVEFGIDLGISRPTHHFLDSLSWFFELEIRNKKCRNKSFYLPKNNQLHFVDSFQNTIFINPQLSKFFHGAKYNKQIVFDMHKYVYNDAIIDINNIIKHGNFNYDLTIWLGIPGERRVWLDQFKGIPSILQNIAKYFPKIKLYVDGVTAYDGERIEVADNLKTFESIKAAVDKLNLDIDMESLSGHDYRTKICYCSTCDIVISEVSTTALVPFDFCKKPGVAFYYDINITYNYALDYQKHIKSLYIVEKNFLIVNARNWRSMDFHIPWQHLYNLAAQSLEEIKGIKMHRLDVPPVALLAKQHELEQELGIKLPIESVALCNKTEKQTDEILKENFTILFTLTYGTAKSRIQNQLSYKLGQALLDKTKGLWKYIRMPYVLFYIKDIHNKDQKAYNKKIKANPSLKLPPLESYPGYKEALKHKEHLFYKLGQALIEAHKNWYKGGYIKFIFDFIRIKKEYKEKVK